MRRTLFWGIGLSLLVLNITIFLFRQNGFDYKDFATRTELYGDPEKSGDKPALPGDLHRFSKKELEEAREILRDAVRIDTCTTTLSQLLTINHFLYRSICEGHAFGQLSKTYDSPLLLFQALRKNKQETFFCGHAAYLQAYFLSAVNLPYRPIQHIYKPGSTLPPDSHVYNEVWISELRNWIISDFYQNRHLIERGGRYLSAADLLDNGIRNDTATYWVTKTVGDTCTRVLQPIQDPYFSKSYFLAFFREIDPDLIYTWSNKLQHYFLSKSHFQVYDPVETDRNGRHHLKQVLFFGWLLWLSIFVFSQINKRLDRGKKHTKIL